jgi:hypothetical protein
MFRQYEDGSRVFVAVDDNASTAKTQAKLLKEQSGWDHLVFNLRTMIKMFDTGLYDRPPRKWNAMRGRNSERKSD